MSEPRIRPSSSSSLPPAIRALFWDRDGRKLSWEKDRDLILGRVLAVGTWDDIQWLRRLAGDGGVRDWLLRRRGGGLSPQQLRFWELILSLPRQEVDAWLKEPGRQVWDRRHAAP